MSQALVVVVEDAFSIEGRGTVVTGVWRDEAQRLLVGEIVDIFRPDGTSFETSLTGVELFTKCFGTARNIGLLLGAVREKAEVPRGAEVWLRERK